VIRLDISTLVFLYLLCTMAAVFFLWFFLEKKAAFPKFVREEADVWECTICAYTYVDSTHHEISQCPQCKSYNKKAPDERLV
jgi:hypothetical protein